MDSNKRIADLENEISELKKYLRDQEDERVKAERAAKYKMSMLGVENMRPNFSENVVFEGDTMVVIGDLPGVMPELRIDEYMEYATADWSDKGIQYNYVQAYAVEPSIYAGLQGDDIKNKLDAYSFVLVAEHVKDNDLYIGARVYPQGTNIPLAFDGKITIHAICTGLVGGEEPEGGGE